MPTLLDSKILWSFDGRCSFFCSRSLDQDCLIFNLVTIPK
uniref:Uncharacterized protein n=1 Tax=CrAss-like virus sp. ctYsL76 TaxID=2826826 RepID=A0A8S5QLL6_9CAUD|nr:MAG TPA: hypothetical protein [CrAss-like virus sp. ctYsL76]